MGEQPPIEARTALRTSGRPPGRRGTRPGGLPGLAGAGGSMWGLCCEDKESTCPHAPPVPSRSGPQGRGAGWVLGTPGPGPACLALPRPAFPVCDDLGVKAGDFPLQMEALVPEWVGGQARDKFYTRARAIHHSVATWKGHVPADHRKPTSFPDRGLHFGRMFWGRPLHHRLGTMNQVSWGKRGPAWAAAPSPT